MAVGIAVLVLVSTSACATDTEAVGKDGNEGSTTTEVNPLTDADKARFAFGQEITITDKAPLPKELVAIMKKPVRIHNQTNQEQRIEFVNWSPDGNATPSTSEPIAPGKTLTLTIETARVISYHLAGNPAVQGVLRIDPGTNEF